MVKTQTTKEDTRCVLIETGINLMLEKGYNNTGLSEVLGTCGVPKGSFYYYFKSKEDFGLAIINTFDHEYVAMLDQVLCNPSLSPLERLRQYLDDGIAKAEQRQCSRGCLIGNLSQEMADQNETFRLRLKEIICHRRQCFAQVIAEAKEKGEIRLPIDPTEAAEFFLSAFEGAIMRSKVQKDLMPFQVLRRFIFGIVFGRPDLLIDQQRDH